MSSAAPRRLLAGLLTVLALVGTSVAATTAAAPPARAEASSEASFLDLLNRERTARGLRAYASAGDLVSVARWQSTRMATLDSLHHNASLTTMVTGWLALGENVGYGGSAQQVHDALMASPGHRANILSTTFSQVGIGTVVDARGRLWVTQVFRKPVGRSPIGSLDAVSTGLGTVAVRGWTLDPDTSASLATHVYVDGRAVRGLTADQSRPDVGAAYGLGDRHGYSTSLVLSEGRHSVCTYGLNAAGTGGGHTRLGCRDVVVRHSPIGALDAVGVGAGSVTARGWSIDPDTRSAGVVHLYVDGRAVKGVTAGLYRSDLARAFPLQGGYHGFAVSVPVARGTHTVCAYGLNVAGTLGGARRLGCRTVTV